MRRSRIGFKGSAGHLGYAAICQPHPAVKRFFPRYAQVAEGDLETAKNIAVKVEKAGEKTGLTKVSWTSVCCISSFELGSFECFNTQMLPQCGIMKLKHVREQRADYRSAAVESWIRF